MVVIGGLLTISLGQFWILQWSKSGLKFPVGVRQSVMLPAGRSLVYYESPHSVPAGRVTLQLYDLQGIRHRMPILTEDINYKIRISGSSGRALWSLDLKEPGEYRFIVTNENVMSDEDIPPEDQIVFLKSPDSLNEAKFIQNTILITGASITFVLMIVFYLMHLATISRLNAGRKEAEQFEGEFELEP